MARWEVTLMKPDNPEEQLAHIIRNGVSELVEAINEILEENGYEKRVTKGHIETLSSEFRRKERASTVAKYDFWIKISKFSASTKFGDTTQ